MKILLVITKAEIGGAQTFILSLARGLKRMGIQVAVASGDGLFLPNELEKDDIPFFYLKNLKRNKNLLMTWLFIRELKKLIDDEGFNVIHLNSTNTLPAIFAVKLSNCKPKVVFTVHGLSVFDPEYKAKRLLKLIFKTYFSFFLRYIETIVFVSRYNLEEAFKQGITRRGVVIYNGLDIYSDYFLSRDKARQELGRRANKNLDDIYLIGSIGRLAEQKNYDFIIKNWPEIKKIKLNAKLMIIGAGPEREKYEKIINKLDVYKDVFLLGEMIDASRILKGFDLFVLPSIYEGLSISLIEALFSGIPVLASDVGGNSEVIGPESCFKLNDNEDFLEKFKQTHNTQKDISLFTADGMVKKYLEIYEI